MTIALIVCFIVPLLVGICCVVSRVYRRNGKLSLRYQSARAAKRRNSVLALSTMDLSAAGTLSPGREARSEDGNDDGNDSSSTAGGSVPSSTNPRRSYDAVYRTHEPLPNKPNVEFDPNKVWDLDAEYEGQLDKVEKRTAIYVPGSPTTSAPPVFDQPSDVQRPLDRDALFAGKPPTGRRLPREIVNATVTAAASDPRTPSVAVQRQILPSRFKDF